MATPPRKIRLTLTLNSNRQQKTLCLADASTPASLLADITRHARNKLKFKTAPPRCFLVTAKNTAVELPTDDPDAIHRAIGDMGACEMVLSKGEEFVGTLATAAAAASALDGGSDSTAATYRQVHLIAKQSLVEDEAVKQVHRTVASCRHVFSASGMPDLHPGSTFPIGVAFLSQRDVIYPLLVGNDIGCGMALYTLPVASATLDPEKIKRKLGGLEAPFSTVEDPEAWRGYCVQELAGYDCPGGSTDATDATAWFRLDEQINRQIGTIGGGNHFAELLAVDELFRPDLALGLMDADSAYLLVHSGSRLLGQKVVDAFRQEKDTEPQEPKQQDDKDDGDGDDGGVHVGSRRGAAYLERHDYACSWARANRKLIARRFLDCLGIQLEETRLVLDVWHNCVSRATVPIPAEPAVGADGADGAATQTRTGVWIHRKGAAPSDCGPVVIPGSRGAYSYLVCPRTSDTADLQPLIDSGFSLAHGAGRKIQRNRASTKIRDKFRKASAAHSAASCADAAATTSLLLQTPFQSAVICDDHDLLAEEHQDAYKEIEDIINDLLYFGLIDVVARFRPMVTYKMRNQ